MTLAEQHKAIVSQVDERFVQARESGDLLFFPSEVHHHEEAGIQVRTPLYLNAFIVLMNTHPLGVRFS